MKLERLIWQNIQYKSTKNRSLATQIFVAPAFGEAKMTSMSSDGSFGRDAGSLDILKYYTP